MCCQIDPAMFVSRVNDLSDKFSFHISKYFSLNMAKMKKNDKKKLFNDLHSLNGMIDLKISSCLIIKYKSKFYVHNRTIGA